MTHFRMLGWTFAFAVSLALAAGCSQGDAPAANAKADAASANGAGKPVDAAPPGEHAGAAAAAAVPEKTTADEASKAATDKSGAVPASNTTAAKAAPAEPFQPPYPQRENMFRRPSTDNHKAAQAEKSSDIELKGFVNLDGLRAVLVIDGKTVAVKQGEQRGEIEVIEVTPPKVILQRGRNRWTTQLFEPPTNKTAALNR